MKRSGNSPTVVHIVPAFFSNSGIIGGAERYALELAKKMAEYVPTSLVSYGPTTEKKRIGNLDVRIIGRPWRVRGQPGNPFSLRMLGAISDADVVHCHQQFVFSTSIAAIWSRLRSRRVFVTECGGGGWDISTYVSTDNLFHRHLHVSDYSRTLAGHRDDAAAVILGGVDTSRFRPGNAPRSESVLFVGRILPHKGIDNLIRGLPDGIELNVVGQPYSQPYLSLLKELSNGKHINFHHDFPDEKLVAAYQTAMCVVLPSVYEDVYGQTSRVPELLGQTLLEGMACGTPAICTDAGGMTEVVADESTGFIVPTGDSAALGDRINWLRTHPDEAARMGKAARQRVLDRFTWESVVERCLKAYRS